MTVTRVERDDEALTLTLVAEFAAPIERVWQLWADPRKLERWWGPPTFPATFVRHDLTVGGEAAYFMTGPEGQESHGWWRVTSVDPPRSLEFVDGFANRDGTPRAGSPTIAARVRLTEQGGGTRMELRLVYASREHMAQIERLGAFDVFPQVVGQMDALLDNDGG